MTDDEVAKRLEAGEDAFDLSIEKWTRLKQAIQTAKLNKKDPGIFNRYIFANSCALCLIHISDDDTECYGNQIHGILPCPLATVDQRCNLYSAWGDFKRNPTEQNAQAMIDWIQFARGDFPDHN